MRWMLSRECCRPPPGRRPSLKVCSGLRAQPGITMTVALLVERDGALGTLSQGYSGVPAVPRFALVGPFEPPPS